MKTFSPEVACYIKFNSARSMISDCTVEPKLIQYPLCVHMSIGIPAKCPSQE
jgi:hypothetical protein